MPWAVASHMRAGRSLDHRTMAPRSSLFAVARVAAFLVGGSVAFVVPPAQQHLSGRAPAAALTAASIFNGRQVSIAPTSTASGGGGGTGAARQPRVRGGGGGGGLRMAESETIDVTLKKPMGIVLEENVSGFGGLRVKEVTDGGSAQESGVVRVGDQLIAVQGESVKGADFDEEESVKGADFDEVSGQQDGWMVDKAYVLNEDDWLN